MLDGLLDHLARSRGIGDAYYDYRGELRYFSAATKTAILDAMGCNVTDADVVRGEIEALDASRWRSLLPGVSVVRRGHAGVIVGLPADELDQRVEWRIALEAGGERTGGLHAVDLGEIERRELDGRWLTRRVLALPEDLPHGHHTLEVRTGHGATASGALVVAPARCYEPDALAGGTRFWGLAVQLYTLRSPGNWGIGDFADLRTVVRHAAGQGAAYVGLNPLHALFPSNPSHFSPYSPSTRHFLNVLYLAVPELPEYAQCAEARAMVERPEFQAGLERLRATELVDYEGVTRAKLPVLALLHAEFRKRHGVGGTDRARAFEAWRRERGETLRLHALHEAVDAHLRAQDPSRYWGWPVWPEEYRDPSGTGVRGYAERHPEAVEFHEWLQWVADEQLAATQRLARELGMAIGLYGDYAVGVNPSGSETWSDQQLYRMGAGVGAPPDPLALKGQDWGIPPQDPSALVAQRYRPFRELVSANMRHFGALRLDHVMALFRQWWVPVGLGATDGGYVHYPLDDLMSVLALESERHRCLVVGEDLGTVPDEVRRAMASFAVYSYKVLLFEKHGDGRFRRPDEYVRRAIATVTTHDLPTLRGYWAGHDLALRDRLQLFPGEEIRRHVYEERVRDRAQMIAALEGAGLSPSRTGDEAEHGYSESLAHAIQVYLAKSAASLVVLQYEDLVGMTDPVNVPGTSHEHANWQRKVTVGIDDALGRESTLRLFDDIRRARAS
ncbi:MAG: 4-alpha-glucanotransferase [Lysobacterales bacterium]|nr:MAG: 4-alpha-glucanotransferase [Xanthomonadales bacterium]